MANLNTTVITHRIITLKKSGTVANYRGIFITFIMKQVALFKLSLLLKIDLQNTQTLQLNVIRNYLQQ